MTLDVTGLTKDADMLQRIFAGWLGERGYVVRDSKDNATYHLEIITNSFGPEYAETFIGMPAFQSVLIPFALPELALYKAQYETGFARYYVNVREIATDHFVALTPIYTGETYYNDYTIFFLFRFSSSNLVTSPQVGMWHDRVDSGLERPFHSKDANGEETP